MKLSIQKQVLVLCFLAIIFRIPSLFEPQWYGDEGIYLTIGQSLARGQILYRDIHDNKPPLIYVVAMLTLGNQLGYRALLLVWNTLSVVWIFLILKRLLGNRTLLVWLLSGLFILFTCLPTFEGTVGNGELFFLMPNLLAVLLLLYNKNYFWAGCLFGVAALFKVPAAFELLAWPIYWMCISTPKDWFRRCFLLGLGFAAPILISVGYFGFYGVVRDYLQAAGGQNLQYVSSWGEDTKSGLYLLSFRALVVAILIGLVILLRRYLQPLVVFFLSWFIFGVFAALLSGRPYPHYLLQLAGILCIGFAIWWLSNRFEKLVSFLIGLILLFVVWFIFTDGGSKKFPTYATTIYYKNFFQYVTGSTSRSNYFATFDSQVLNNYDVGIYLANNTKPYESIFIWGDQPMIYALANRQPLGKYTAAYHIKDFRAEKQTLALLLKNHPVYIVRYDTAGELAGLDELLLADYREVRTFGPAHVYRYNPY